MKLNSTKLNKALNFTSWARVEHACPLTKGRVSSLITERELEAIRQRKAKQAPYRYPLFAQGRDPYVFAEQVMQGEGSVVFQTCELNRMDKIGEQGYSFPAAYVWDKTVYKYYLPDKYPAALEDPDLKDYVQYVADDLKDRIGHVTPLSWGEAVELVCSKDKHSYPFGGSKDDVMTREYLLGHPGEMGDSAGLGQRYQRNKQDEKGYPIPRATFNSDVRTVVCAAQLLNPLIKAFQRDALEDPTSPYVMYLGDEAVGRAITKWLDKNPNMAMTSVMGDVKGMDTCVRLKHAMVVLEILKPLYDEQWHDQLEQVLTDPFLCGLQLDDDHYIAKGVEHTVFSGVFPTHIIEDIWTHINAVRWVDELYVELPGKSATWKALDAWKPVLILCNGDDGAILLALPNGYKVIDAVTERETTFQEKYVEVLQKHGFDAALQKQHVFYNYVEFSSKIFRPSVTVIKKGEEGLKPIYPISMAVNSVLFPEDPCLNPSFTQEVVRVAQICDLAFGSERYDRLVTNLWLTLSKDNQGKLAELLVGAWDDVPAVRAVYAGTVLDWQLEQPEFDPQHSPTLRAWAKLAGLTAPEIKNLRQVLNDAHQLRRLHWMYHIDPMDVLQGIAGNPSRMRYYSIFNELPAMQQLLDGEGEMKWLSIFAEGLAVDADGDPCPMRDVQNYVPTAEWEKMFLLDKVETSKTVAGPRSEEKVRPRRMVKH